MRMYRIGKFAKLVGVTTTTLKNWEKQGILKPALKTPHGERRYSEEQLQQVLQNMLQNKDVKTYLKTKRQDKPTITNNYNPVLTDLQNQETTDKFQNKPDISQTSINIGYARVSTKEQENELKRQIDLLELYLVKQGKPFKIISDIGSGIDYSKQGLNELLKLISSNQVDTIYILYKDRLVRFGFKLIEEFAKLHNTRIEVMNQTEDKIDEEEFVEDIVNIVQIFSYIFDHKSNGNKSDINKKIAQRLND